MDFHQRKTAMIHTPETLALKAAEVRRLLTKATDALATPEVLEAVTLYALSRPEIEWEPVALAACALDAKWELDKAKPAAPLLEKANLPPDPTTSATAGRGGVSLPPPPWGFA